MKFLWCLLLLSSAISVSAQATENHSMSIKMILAEAPCKEKATRVSAYLNASKHGLWISDSVGSIKTGMPLIIENKASDPSIARLLNYAYKPKVNFNNTFRGTFYGVVVCPVSRKTKPYFRVNKIDNIQTSPIRSSSAL